MVDLYSLRIYQAFQERILKWFYLQGLQIAFLWVTEQGRDAMIVPHTANIGVSPQWEDLTNDGHPTQGAVNQLHDICITHLLKMKKTDWHFRSFLFLCEIKCNFFSILLGICTMNLQFSEVFVGCASALDVKQREESG